jgi:hypothetical protein
MFENSMLRRIFGPKTEEVAGGWRKLHNEELHGSRVESCGLHLSGSGWGPTMGTF